MVKLENETDTPTTKYICEPCRTWFLQGISQFLFDLNTETQVVQMKPPLFESDKKETKPDYITLTKALQDIFSCRHSCWFCATLWVDYCRNNSFNDAYNGKPNFDQDKKVQISLSSPGPIQMPLMRTNYCYPEIMTIKSENNTHFNVAVYRDDWHENYTMFNNNRSNGTWQHVLYQLDFSRELATKRLLVDAEKVQDSFRADLVTSTATDEPYKHPDDLSPDRVSRIREWLEQCDNCHDGCRQVAEERKKSLLVLPARLVEILRDEADGQLQVRICKTLDMKDDEKTDIHYATMSHCWGTGQHTDKLLRANYHSLTCPFPTSNLNSMNRQVVHLCATLNIRYIWIDSLCIIQDDIDNTDWLQEAPKMHQVYGRSYLNIAATASGSSAEGLLRELNPLAMHGIAFDIPNHCHISLTMGDPSCRLMALSHRQSRLFERGWVYQEIVLSLRTIKICDGQMYWACGDRYRGLQHEVPSRHQYDYFLNKLYPKPLPTRKEEASTLNLACEWMSMAQIYASTKVSFLQDRYHAMSGVVTLLHEKYTELGISTYLVAGCWYHQLEYWILWQGPASKLRFLSTTSPCTDGDNSKHEEKQTAYIPSWSWLSCQGEARFVHATPAPLSAPIEDNSLSKMLFKVHDLQHTLKYPQLPYGPVSMAILTLYAPVVHLTVELPSFSTSSPSGQNNMLNAKGKVLSIDINNHGQIETIRANLQLAEYEDETVCIFDHLPRNYVPHQIATFKCLVLFDMMMSECFSIVLEGPLRSTSAACKPLYQRIGSLKFHPIKDVTQLYPQRDQNGHPLPGLILNNMTNTLWEKLPLNQYEEISLI